MPYHPLTGTEHPLRGLIRQHYLADENEVVNVLLQHYRRASVDQQSIQASAREQVENLNSHKQSLSLIDRFMQEFSLTSDEGVVLMCIAEALLRIPDTKTADALIHEKLAIGDWESHIGSSESLLVNAATWGMMLTGKWMTNTDVAKRDIFGSMRRMIQKSGEPAIRLVLRQAMKMMGQEFVLAQSMDEALIAAKKQQDKGFSYSYDMLGESAKTKADARRYATAYAEAITLLSAEASSTDPIAKAGISIKLSALHCRVEFAQFARLETELYAVLLKLALQAKNAQIGFNIDAEEADRLELSLTLFERLAFAPELSGWDGLGYVVQAYQKRALPVLKWLTNLAQRSNRKFMLRLVKGAYWDSEIKHAQVAGHEDFPVFTRKENTDLSYLVCAQYMLKNVQAFYPQFATHNAHTVASILHFVEQGAEFEFQCLHGMAEDLFERVVAKGHRCRIYAPVGEHKQLLAYLVRRLLENGANTSFVNMLANREQDIESIIASPVDKVSSHTNHRHGRIPLASDLYMPAYKNSLGANLGDSDWLDEYYKYFTQNKKAQWSAKPLIHAKIPATTPAVAVINPATKKAIGSIRATSEAQIDAAFSAATTATQQWNDLGGRARACILERAADRIEANRFELLALCQLEAGKTLADAVAEVREAVDFMRYYAARAKDDFDTPRILPGPTGELNEYSLQGRGIVVAISPWNFPLAIFMGQVSAALLAGNTVLAKPAEQTSLIAYRAVQILYEAGVPKNVLQLLPGSGQEVGAKLTSDSSVDAVVFTGGTETARQIQTSLSERPNAPLPQLMAETGGLNAMIVDSSALLEQVVTDVISSAFQSAGQRCSALRVLYVQTDIAKELITMISGAMDALITGDPTDLGTDIGPIIDEDALMKVETHIKKFKNKGLIVRSPIGLGKGYFCAPALIEIDGIHALKREIFGPVLHIVRYQSDSLDDAIDDINLSGYGLTLGVHSRINKTVQRIRARAKVGNLYVNRNIIGAVVGSQPFGGERLSGTGPKAGGPHYLHRFAVERVVSTDTTAAGGNASLLTLD